MTLIMSSFEACHQCTKRTVNCHATCKEYIQEKAIHDSKQAQKRANSNQEYTAYARSKFSKIEKASKRKYNKS